MSAGEVAGLMTAAALLLGAFVAHRKFGPERNDITITSADKVNAMTLRFAGQVGEENESLRDQISSLERRFTEYQVESEEKFKKLNDQLSAAERQLARSESEKARLAEENTLLRDRVKALEAEVAALKANGAHSNSS